MNSNAAARLPFLKSLNAAGTTTPAGPKVAGASQGDSHAEFSRLLVSSRKAVEVPQRAGAPAVKTPASRRPDAASPDPRTDGADSRPADVDTEACETEALQDAAQSDGAAAAPEASAQPAERPVSPRLKHPPFAGKGSADAAAPGSATADVLVDPSAVGLSALPVVPTAADPASLAAWGFLPMPPVAPRTAATEGEAPSTDVAAPPVGGPTVPVRGSGDARADVPLSVEPTASSDATEPPATRALTDKSSLAIDPPAAPASGPASDAALAGLAMLSAGVRPESEPRLRQGTDLATPPAWAVGAAGVPTPSRAGDAVAQPVPAMVATPLTDSGFHEALGLQVSRLAREGIHKAELRLNPADMGPVSVQITMNGDQARVDFGADLAQTRQVIEAGWAELAASLQEAGFTLSGGGVSQHARDPQAPPDRLAGALAAARPADDFDEAPAASVITGRPRAGAALDLYA